MPDRYAVIGSNTGQSKSPLIHTLFAQACAQDMTYGAIDASADGFAAAVQAFGAAGGRGLNVTMPFKINASELATDRLERARMAGASNVLKFDADRVLADNFDGLGLVTDIERNHGVALAGKRVLLLGAGGAARGVLHPLLERRPGEIAVVNRSVDKALELAARFAAAGTVSGCGYGDLAHQAFDVVINATAASMTGEAPPLPASVFRADALAYELAYGKGLTPFLALARDAGARRVTDGIGMLVEQAALAFQWWRGMLPATRSVIERLTVPLQ